MKTEQLQRIEDSYSERNARYWKQNLAVCVFGSFTTAVSLTMLLPFLPIFVEELGIKQQASIVQWSALAFGATFLGTGLTAPLWGHLGDKYGRKSMLVRAAIGMAVIMSLIGLVQNVYQLVLLRLVAGLVGGSSSSMLLVATQTPRERAGWALGVSLDGSTDRKLDWSARRWSIAESDWDSEYLLRGRSCDRNRHVRDDLPGQGRPS